MASQMPRRHKNLSDSLLKADVGIP